MSSNNKIEAENFELTKKHKTNFKKSEITRTNMTSTFTVEDLEDDMANLDRMQKEATAQVGLSKSVVENIAHHHPMISKLSDEQLAQAAYLHETKQVLNKAEKTLKDVKDARKKYNAIIAAVYSKFGFSDVGAK